MESLENINKCFNIIDKIKKEYNINRVIFNGDVDIFDSEKMIDIEKINYIISKSMLNKNINIDDNVLIINIYDTYLFELIIIDGYFEDNECNNYCIVDKKYFIYYDDYEDFNENNQKDFFDYLEDIYYNYRYVDE